MSAINKINLKEKLDTFNEHWNPKVIAELNGQHVKLAKILGEFIWHKHDEEDELFMVLSGRLTMELRNGTIDADPGEVIVIPKGVEHRPCASEETHILLFEPTGTVNTGQVHNERTVDDPERI